MTFLEVAYSFITLGALYKLLNIFVRSLVSAENRIMPTQNSTKTSILDLKADLYELVRQRKSLTVNNKFCLFNVSGNSREFRTSDLLV